MSPQPITMWHHSPFTTSLALAIVAALAFAGSPVLGHGDEPGVSNVQPASSSDPAIAEEGLSMLPVLASSELAAGPNRFLFSLADLDGALVASPEVSVGLDFYDVERETEMPTLATNARFLWTLEDVRGLYVADVEFPYGGRWGTRFEATFPDSTTRSVRIEYDVLDQSWTPAIGALAPIVDTPTAADAGGDLSRISTDTDPQPRFYEVSVADALGAGQPFVLVFATPAFCQSAGCGPLLEQVKTVAADNPELTFINVEPYVMDFRDGALQPSLDELGRLEAAPWTDAWRLLTEPYVVVVDDQGIVRAKFEGALSLVELSGAIAGL